MYLYKNQMLSKHTTYYALYLFLMILVIILRALQSSIKLYTKCMKGNFKDYIDRS